ncbi:sensor histidine kinase [Paraclostridium ghonii]|uniref:histidine kinase n=1 Tax=Paraclostridium ghonii TaxID=29358 RepID=A0ABU0MZS2_9FIRM|nr:sensor histidine kinase [Paeniclostridium ghonii]MDQ0556411.1 signal transduction histidine kinase [Paeniclostridium ghonii]
MRLADYIKDKIVYLVLYIFLITSVLFFLFMYRVPVTLTISIITVMVIFMVTVILIDYYRKKSFFQKFNEILDSLDKKYLITEMVDSPTFIEGRIFYESLYEIDKSMHEEIDIYKKSVNDFKEYIEMWIHEVKLPIASTTLILHNNKDDAPKKIKEQINRIENYVEEVLYFVRSDNVEKDYIIKPFNLEEIINPVIRRNKDNLLLKKISIEIEDLNHLILTDSKWMGFIINQIVSNSIKYSKENPKIKIEAKTINDEVVLEIEDNGIGINEKDITKVFNKSFTGENGRKIRSSTGMGLYLVKKLCDKLGHKVKIESQVGEFTKVSICFTNNKYYSCVR